MRDLSLFLIRVMLIVQNTAELCLLSTFSTQLKVSIKDLMNNQLKQYVCREMSQFLTPMYLQYPKTLSGDIIISCFLVRIRRNVKSFPGSRSRRVLRACSHSRVTSVAYCIVVTLSNDVLMAAPSDVVTTTPTTPSWSFSFLNISSTSD
uniref:Secreted protein n=1 Tax=Rhipicephalus microplus TaxID=6941 RepID=A0A6G5A960_RHIMP